MLVLSRRMNESILIGRDIKVTVVQMQGGKVRLGIECPDDTAVYREEVARRIAAETRRPVPWDRKPSPRPSNRI